MAYAGDKLYNDFIRRNMSHLTKDVKATEIVLHLPCLTQTDREEIYAKMGNSGNSQAMVVLLDNVRKRENWPEEFIQALMNTEHLTLSDEMQNAYDKIRRISRQRSAPASTHPFGAVASALTPASSPVPTPTTSSPVPASSPVAASATVTTAAILNAPLPVEKTAMFSDPSSINTPHESLPNTNTSKKVEVSVLESSGHSPPEPIAHMEPVPISFSNAVPPALVIVPNVPATLEQNKFSLVLSPAETHMLSISDKTTLTGLSGSSLTGPHLPPSNSVDVTLSESDSAGTVSQHPAAPEDSQVPLVVATDDLMSMKRPIQDTNSSQKVNISAENPTKGSTVSQVGESVHITASQVRECSQVRSPETVPVSDNTVPGPVSHRVSEDGYFSKPGILRAEEPCSVTSEELEISCVTTESGSASQVQSASHDLVSKLPRTGQRIQEPCSASTYDGIFPQATTAFSGTRPVQDPPNVQSSYSAINVPVQEPVPVLNTLENHHDPVEDSYYSHKQPVEDHYESFCPSLQSDQSTMLHVGEVSEEPLIQNLSGQTPSMIDNINHLIELPISLTHNSQTESHLSVEEHAFREQDNVQQVHGDHFHAGEHAGPGIDLPACVEPVTNAGVNSSGRIKTIQAEQGEQPEKTQGVLANLQSYPHLMAVAAAIGVTAVFMAWKFKY